MCCLVFDIIVHFCFRQNFPPLFLKKFPTLDVDEISHLCLEKNPTFVFDAGKWQGHSAIRIVPLTSAGQKRQFFSNNFVTFSLIMISLFSSCNHHHESSSLSFVPVNVCAVFGFVTIRTSSRPVLIGAQVVPICPSDCYQDHDHDDHDEHNDHDHDDNDQQS